MFGNEASEGFAVTMESATCGVLTAIFPIVLLTVVLERRAIHVNIRRRNWFRIATQLTLTASMVGLLTTVWGVQAGGLGPILGTLAWAAFLLAVGGLVFNLIATAASSELEEDDEAA